jgi:hypothetical protein
MHTCMYIYIYIVTEHNSTSEFIWEREGKKMLENEKYWNNPFIYEYNIVYCAVYYWILGEYGDTERVSNKGANLIKAQYI